MGFFNFGSGPDINVLMEEAKETEGSVVIDVRTEGEYAQGHIAGSINIPMDKVQVILNNYTKETPLYIYCLSGARSDSVVSYLEDLGYNAIDMGGIMNWEGNVEV